MPHIHVIVFKSVMQEIQAEAMNTCLEKPVPATSTGKPVMLCFIIQC